jgi:ankyrin repeat protein
VVKSLITRGADVKSVDRHKRTALMVACAQGHVETIQILLEGGSDVESRDKSSG